MDYHSYATTDKSYIIMLSTEVQGKNMYFIQIILSSKIIWSTVFMDLCLGG